MDEEFETLLAKSISQIKSVNRPKKSYYILDITEGLSVARLWPLGGKVSVPVEKDEKVEEVKQVLEKGKIPRVVVEELGDGMVRGKIVKVEEGPEPPKEKMVLLKVEPDRRGIKLTADGTVLRPDPFSFNTQRLLKLYEDGIIEEIYAVPGPVDSRNCCFGIFWIANGVLEYAVETEVKTTDEVKEIVGERKKEEEEVKEEKEEIEVL